MTEKKETETKQTRLVLIFILPFVCTQKKETTTHTKQQKQT